MLSAIYQEHLYLNHITEIKHILTERKVFTFLFYTNFVLLHQVSIQNDAVSSHSVWSHLAMLLWYIFI